MVVRAARATNHPPVKPKVGAPACLAMASPHRATEANLDHLRLLHRAAQEGLITDAEHQQHRQQLLQNITAVQIVQRHRHLQEEVQTLVEKALRSKRMLKFLITALAHVVKNPTKGKAATRKPPTQVLPPTERIQHVEAQRPEMSPRGCEHDQFMFNRRGFHRDTYQKLPDLDPLEVEVTSLFQRPHAEHQAHETEAQKARSGSKRVAPHTRDRSALDRVQNALGGGDADGGHCKPPVQSAEPRGALLIESVRICAKDMGVDDSLATIRQVSVARAARPFAGVVAAGVKRNVKRVRVPALAAPGAVPRATDATRTAATNPVARAHEIGRVRVHGRHVAGAHAVNCKCL